MKSTTKSTKRVKIVDNRKDQESDIDSEEEQTAKFISKKDQ